MKYHCIEDGFKHILIGFIPQELFALMLKSFLHWQSVKGSSNWLIRVLVLNRSPGSLWWNMVFRGYHVWCWAVSAYWIEKLVLGLFSEQSTANCSIFKRGKHMMSSYCYFQFKFRMTGLFIYIFKLLIFTFISFI